jgi:hypothetical protein
MRLRSYSPSIQNARPYLPGATGGAGGTELVTRVSDTDVLPAFGSFACCGMDFPNLYPMTVPNAVENAPMMNHAAFSYEGTRKKERTARPSKAAPSSKTIHDSLFIGSCMAFTS